jgi:hypothetical protein
MDNSWTYKYAPINEKALAGIQQELINLWNEYTSEKNYTTCRFVYIVMDQKVSENCPELVKEVARLKLNDILEGVGFLVVPPGCYTPLHTDNGTSITLSIPVINCDDSYTVWYRDPERLELNTDLDHLGIGKDTLLNPDSAEDVLVEYLQVAQLPYFKIDAEKELDRVECTRALWLNTAIPHRAEVLHNELRVLATLRFTELPNLEH